jgi:hypothetical protein
MLVRQAKIFVHKWVLREVNSLPGFKGAFFHVQLFFFRLTSITPLVQ